MKSTNSQQNKKQIQVTIIYMCVCAYTRVHTCHAHIVFNSPYLAINSTQILERILSSARMSVSLCVLQERSQVPFEHSDGPISTIF